MGLIGTDDMQRRCQRELRAPRALLLCSLCFSAPARAQVHPGEPAVNLGQTSFLDGQGGPGWVAEEFVDNTRDPTGIGLTALSHVAYTSTLRLFGAYYGVEVLAPYVHVDAGHQGIATGWGDLTVSPFILQWNEIQLGPVRLQQRFDVDLFLPTGQYSRQSEINLSAHTYRVEPYYAFTLLPTRHLETSWRVHYLWNSTNNAPPFASGLRSTQAGQAIHFNATLSYDLPYGVWLGANSYYLTQITAPRVNGQALSNSPEQVGAIGPGVLWHVQQFGFYANAYREFGAINRPAGTTLVLRVQWVPPP
jgi:hypothetical protein